MLNYLIDQNKKDNYNSEPVFYCSQCLALKIKTINDMLYCDSCSSTTIEEDNIFNWEEKYKKKYGNNYINKK